MAIVNQLRRQADISMTIEAEDVPALVLEACPSFAVVWKELEADNADRESPGGRLHYLDASALLRHLVALYLNGSTGEFAAVFDLIERMVLEGDRYVSELAVIGYLEGFQMQTIGSFDLDSEVVFRPWFGPVSKAWWVRLRRFWDGEHDALQVADELVIEEARRYATGTDPSTKRDGS